jgi:hypothetical protein
LKKGISWLLAVVLTLAAAVYQRRTGPTHPVRGKVSVGGTEVSYRLPRSAANDRDCEIALPIADPAVTGTVLYRRLGTEGPWARADFARRDGLLVASLPRQRAAAKLSYRIVLDAGGRETSVPGETPIAIRFKGPVPAAVLVVHILVMFAALLFAAMAGITALDPKRNPRAFTLAAAGLFLAGGLVLGPIVQKYAFGVFWAGFPFGTDLTDNKTLLSMAFWVVAVTAGRRGRQARGWVLAASAVTLFINLIPHSLFGSELKP